MFSKSIHDVAGIKPSFLSTAESYFPMQVNPILFIQASVHGHLDLFLIGAVVFNAAVNVCVQVLM